MSSQKLNYACLSENSWGWLDCLGQHLGDSGHTADTGSREVAQERSSKATGGVGVGQHRGAIGTVGAVGTVKCVGIGLS